MASEGGSSGGVGKFFVTLLVAVLIVGLGGAVVYLLSDINRRQYRLATKEGTLLVERGRFLPAGFETFQPDEPDLKSAYAPIPLPPSETLVENEVFSERADLDRVLFSLLAGWARRGLQSSEPGDIELSTLYVTRCELLPGLSEEQRTELRTLRADLAYRNGRRILGDIVTRLEKALAEFKLSVELGTSRPNDAERWIREIRRRMATYAAPSFPGEPELIDPDPATPGVTPGQPRMPGAELEPIPEGTSPQPRPLTPPPTTHPSPSPVPGSQSGESEPKPTPKWRL